MKIVAAALLLSLTGCASALLPMTPPRMDVPPAPFPFPGIYNGVSQGGQITMQIGADGRGRECTRALTGFMSYGDLVYTGPQLLSESLAFTVARVTRDELALEWPKSISVTADPPVLHRVSEAPTTCREFFAK